ncbi:kelch repeat-containing protein [Dehalobacter sp.]|uniref:Kelch repeat-containing protein n=1 Tax=Dehalobacter sp. TaxID=1962289 RepID=UPI0025884E7B|nr:kelch repeat-containing protein [Dehalobacter sp.]MCG1025143.1 S8 family serine peptidase [Dehalobacter sp.]
MNEHFNNQENPDLTSKNKQHVPDDLLPDNQKVDRFIIKYKDQSQKENTLSKLKGNVKQRKTTRNPKFDVYITPVKMKKEDFSAMLKQKQADSNIEYIQPDYQITIASAETSDNGTHQPAQNDTTQAPTLSDSDFDGLKITLAYSATLDSSSIPAAADFTAANKNGDSLTFSNIAINGCNLIITLSAPLTAGDPVTLNYTPGTNPIQDTSGSQAAAFSNQQITSNTQATVPVLATAQVIDNILTLQYNCALDNTSTPDLTDFTLTCLDSNGTPVINSIQRITIKDQTVTLILATKLTPDQTVQLSYTPGNNKLKDTTGNLIPAFNNLNITNVSKVAVLNIQAASVNGDQLELDFNATLKQDSIPAAGDFSLVVNGRPIAQAIKSLVINDQKVILTLNTPISIDDQIQISYVPGTNPLQDSFGNKVDSISGFTITNLTQMAVNDTLFGQEWGFLTNIINAITNMAQSVSSNIVNAWKQSQGDNVTVAIIDTGIDITHEDLKDNIWANTKETVGNSTDDDSNGYTDDIHGWNFVNNTNTVYDPASASDDWHGTHIAGIIAAEMGNKLGIAGVSPKVKIMPLQVFKNGTAYTSDIINAINYAKQNGAQIVNCSWGSPSDNMALQEAMASSGLLFICAAGNSGQNIDSNPVYPAVFNLDNIITVASVNKAGNLSSFSNYGLTSVDVAAPGEDITSTLPGNNYGQSGGTSQAAAFVTGEAALILSKYPNTMVSEIKDRIINSCAKLSSLTGKTISEGIIDCTAALTDPVINSNTIIQVQPAPTGSSGSGSGSSDNEGYDLYSVDEWNVRGNLATTRECFGTAAINNKIYCIGGYTNDITNSVEIYDPIPGNSTAAANMSTPRMWFSAAAVGSKIYVFGGMTTGWSVLNTVEVYDIQTNTWTNGPNMPAARFYSSAAVVNGIIYVIGGRDDSYTTVNTVYSFDPISNTWSTKVSMPTARFALNAASCNGKIYAIGGYNSSYKNTVEEYEPVSNTWTTKASMPIAIFGFGSAVLSGKIYVLGGTNGDSLKSTYEYNPNYNLWGQRTDLTTARFDFGTEAVNGKIYALGGQNSTGVLISVEEYGLPASNWKVIKNMPSARSELGTASVNGKIYAIGGYNGTSYLNTVEQYDKTTNAWSTKATMTTARKGLGVAALNGKIYAVGGYNGTAYLNTVEEYDATSNTWASKANMPTARAYLGLTVINNKLYAVGGYNGTSYLNTLEEYDPANNTWTTKANMAVARGYLGLCLASGKIYAIGGCNDSSNLNITEEYNPETNTWTNKVNMLTARRGLGAETVSGKIYAIGGYNGSSYLNIVEQFDASTNTWTSLNKENMFIGREKFGVASLDGKIYVLGGYSGSYRNTVEEYSPEANPWTFKANMPTARAYLGVASVNGKIYAIGGINNSSVRINTVEAFDPATNTWSTKANMPTARNCVGITALDGKIYVIGGYDVNGNTLNTVEVYDPVTDTWSTKAPMPTARLFLGVSTVNGKIYAVGGCSYSTSQIYNCVEEYNPVTNTWATKANMPTTRYSLSVSAINGKLYAIGGFGSDYLGTVEEYNPLTDTWTQRANMPTVRRDFGTIAANGKIYAVGGYSRYTVDSFEEYDPSSNNWNTKELLPKASQALGVAEVNGKIYAIGGCSYTDGSFIRYNAVQEYDLGIKTWETKASMPTSRKDMAIAANNGIIYSLGGNNGSSYLNIAEKYNTNTWSIISNMTTARDGLGADVVNGQIYAVGGYNGSYLNVVEKYDPVAGSWSTKANMPTARRYLGVIALAGKIYAIGGYNGTPLNTVEAYDPATNTWSTKANMPTARYGLTVAVVNGKIEAIGGYNGNYLNTVEEYNPVTNTWTSKANMPTARSGLGSGVVNNKIYLLGGTKGNNIYLDTNEEFDPVNNIWVIKSGLPTARAALGATAVNGKVYAIGGERYNGSINVLNTVEAYDPAVDSTTVGVTYPVARSGLGVADLNGKIYAIGGSNGSSILNTAQVYNGITWSTITSMPTARKDLGLAAINNRLYAIGGYNGSSYLSNVEEYNPETNTWCTKNNMSTARSSFGITVVSGRIYVIGGYNGNSLATVEAYDPVTDTWSTLTSMLTARYDFHAVNNIGLIYTIGGRNNSTLNTVERFDPISNTWSTETSMPTARYGLGAAVVKGKIYAIGGNDGNNYLSIVEEYNPVTKSWSVKTPVLNSRAFFGTVVLGDIVTLVGGDSSSGLLNTIESYNPGLITWQIRENMLTGRRASGSTEVGGKIYVIGGMDINSGGYVYFGNNEAYDPVNNSWFTKASMPTVRWGHGVAAVNGKIYAIGGYNGSSVLNTVEEYDPVTDTWSTKANMPTARFALGVVALEGKIYAIGGAGNSIYRIVEVYDPVSNTWSTKTGAPTARYVFGCTAVNGKIYVIGGSSATGECNTVEQYDPVTNSWNTQASMPTIRSTLGAAAVNGKIYAIGGYKDQNDSTLDSVEVYDPATNVWQTESRMPVKMNGFGISVFNGKIYILGGNPNNRIVLEGNFENNLTSSLSELIHLGEENVNPSGNFARSYTDMTEKTSGFTLDFSRTYNSRDTRNDSMLGTGWSFSFQGSLMNYLTNQVIVRLPNGSAMTFTVNGSTYTANDSRSTLVKQGDGSYILSTKDQYTYGFTSAGWLKWMKDRNGNSLTFTINATNGNVNQIIDQVGRQTNISYNGQGLLSTVTDPLGRIVQYHYNASNKLDYVTDPAGKRRYYTYNSDGLLSEIRDNDNNLIESIVYDNSAGDTNIRIARLTDANGNTSTYMYDTEYRKVTITDTNGREKITWFDSSLYPIQTQDPDGRRSTTIYSLDSNNVNKYGEALSVTDRNGNKTEYVRDSNGNITTIYNPDSSSRTFGYDIKNNKIWEKDEGDQVNTTGKYTYYVYDVNGINLIKKAQRLLNSSTPEQYIPGTNDTDFAVTTYAYYTSAQAQSQFGCNITGLLQSVTDPVGHVTTYTYDQYGNIRTVTDAEGKITTNTNNILGWITSVLSAKGYTTKYDYDNNGNLLKTTLNYGGSNGGDVTRVVHDNMGRQIKVIPGKLYNSSLDTLSTDTYTGNQGTIYTYYPSGKVHTLTDAMGNTTTYTYDLYGNVQIETKPNGSIIQYFYDNLNRLTAVKFQDNAQADLVVLESLTYVILANGNTQKTDTKYLNATDTAVTTYTYDYAERLIRQDNADGTYTTTNYNPNGTVNTTTDERGYSTYYRYDGLNRNNEKWVPAATSGGNVLYTYINTVYEKSGNVILVKTGKSFVDLYNQTPVGFIAQNKTYYNNNKLKSETNSAGYRTDYFYDNDWNLSEKDVYTSSTTKNVTEYINNEFGKPVTIKVHIRAGDLYGNSFSSNTDTFLTTTNTYDKNGNIVTVLRPDNVTITYTYDNLDRLTGTSMPGVDENNNSVTITTGATYDWAGKVLTQTDANGHTSTNTYDLRERLIKVTNAKGNIAAYYYDLGGRLIAEVSPKNYIANTDLSQLNRTTYTYDNMDRVKTKGYTYLDPVTSQWVTFVAKAYKYDQKGNKIKELDALGFEAGTGSTNDAKINSGYGTQYTYDPAGRVLTVLDPVSSDRSLQYTTLYAYDGAGRKVSETNANGIVTAYTYDDAGNLLTQSINNQTVKTDTYDTAGNLISETDGNNNTITYSYNAFYKLKQAVYPGDSTIPSDTVTYQYDTNGNLKQKTDSAGPVDLYTYNKQGNVLSHTQQKSDGTQVITTSIRYDKAGNKRFTIDGNGVTTESTYNELNQLISTSITVHNGNNVAILETTTYTYDADGNQTTKTDWLGNIDTNVYDPLDRLIQKIDPLNKTINKLAYNHNSAQISSTDALNKVTQYTYDKNNRILSTIDPLNHTNSQTYDNVGNIHTKTDADSNITTFNYDAFNRLTSVVNAKSETTSYTYDLNNNKLTQTDGLNHTTTYEYNAANKVTKKIDHDGRTGTFPNYTYNSAKTESYTYDADGNMLTRVDRNGNITTYTYDAHGRLLSQVSGSQSITFTYDGNSNQLTMVDGTGTTTRTYDELNRTKSKTVPGGVGTLTFLYDVTSGLPAGQVSETDTDSKNNITTKVFDKAGRMISVTVGSNTTTYTYYDNGSKASVVYPDGSNEAYTYYDDGTLNTLVNKKADQTVIDSYAYTYDSAKNMLTKVDSRGTTTYTYDTLNRLFTVTEPSSQVTSYTYDAAGNRATQTVTLGTTSTVTTYTYNEQNRLQSTLTQLNGTTTQTGAYTYDNNGNELTQTITPYVNGIPQTPQVTTNTFDRFNQMVTTLTSGGTSITNTYNGEGLRVAKQVNSQTTKYVYVADKVVLELDGSNNQTAFNVQGTTMISRTVGGSTLFYMYNGHADVTALLDSSGTIQATYYYDAFGNILQQTGTVSNNITYAGYQYDKETGLYYLNARMYDPVTARFMQEDTYRGDPNDPLSLNLYSYCHNEPLMYTDPTGHIPLPYVPGLHYSGQMVYGNQTDIANFINIMGIYADDFRYKIGTATNPIDVSQIYYDEVIVGGTAAKYGVPENNSGARRLWGQDRYETIAAIEAYKNLILSSVVIPPPVTNDPQTLATFFQNAVNYFTLNNSKYGINNLTEDQLDDIYYMIYGVRLLSSASKIGAENRLNEGTGGFTTQSWVSDGWNTVKGWWDDYQKWGAESAYDIASREVKRLYPQVNLNSLEGQELIFAQMNVNEAMLNNMIGMISGGGVSSAEKTIAKIVKGEVGSLSKAEILALNRLAGTAAEKVAAQKLLNEGYEIVGSQVSIRTSEGIRRVDHLVRDAEGNLTAIEVKSGNATRNASQLSKDLLIETESGVVVGKNAVELTGQNVTIKTIEMRIPR